MSHTPTLEQRDPNASNGNTIKVPDKLAAHDQWVVWHYGKKRAHNRYEKVPINPTTGKRASVSAPETWRSYEQAIATSEKTEYAGIGFVFSEEDDLCGIDFDDCGNREMGSVHPAVREEIERLGNPYTEWSPSGEGLKCIVVGRKPTDRCVTKATPWGGKLEIYDRDRFFTVTGDVFVGGQVVEAQGAVEDLCELYLPAKQIASTTLSRDVRHDLTDDELLTVARGAKHGKTFTALYDRGDITGSGSDPHIADKDLMIHLAFLTGKDRERMERMFSASALGRRKKWKERADYREWTIDYAVSHTNKVYDPEHHKPVETRVRDQLFENALHALFIHPWKGIMGSTKAAARDYFGYRAELKKAYKVNSNEIDLSVRDYQIETGLGSNGTAWTSLKRLENSHGLVEMVKDGDLHNAARYKIKEQEVVSKPDHTEIDTGCSTEPCVTLCLSECDPAVRLEELLHLPTHLILNKALAWVFDIAHAVHLLSGMPVSLDYLAERTGIRKNNLTHRYMRTLVDADLLVEVEGGYAVTKNVEDTLDKYLRDTQAYEKDRMTRETIERQRRTHRIETLHRQGQDAEGISTHTGYSVAEVLSVLESGTLDRAPAIVEEPHIDSIENGEVLTVDTETSGVETEEIETVSSPTERAPSDHEDVAVEFRVVDAEPCIHSYGSYVYPGGRGCYLCDPDHPHRLRERERRPVLAEAA